MTALPELPSLRPEPARNGYGHYLLPDPNTGRTRAFTRATTLAHAISDEYQLTLWKRRMVAMGLALDSDALAQVAAIGEPATRDDREALNELCDQAARAAGADKGSEAGTFFHTCTEWADVGRLDEIAHLIPAEIRADLDVYLNVMGKAGIRVRPESVERIVVNTTVEAAGTADRLPVELPDGRLVVADVKTQKTVDFGWLEIAIQLAEYVNADAMYDPTTAELVPMPEGLDKTVGLVMHCPVGKKQCNLYEVDLVAGWEAAQAAYHVRQLRQRSKAMGRPHVPRPAAVATAGADERLLYLIRHAGHPNALTALWRDARDEWTDTHTKAAAARKAELLAGTA
jgi:hypothetical protein